MTPDETLAIMGAPAERLPSSGVEEWRYCARRSDGDVFAVFYFHNGRVIEKATYILNSFIQSSEEGLPNIRVGESCLDNLGNIYTDRRSPPRRVQEIQETNPGGSMAVGRTPSLATAWTLTKNGYRAVCTIDAHPLGVELRLERPRRAHDA